MQQGEHSPLGGSGMYRWRQGVCPGSAALSDGVSEEESEFAAEGTAAHALAAYCLRENLDAWQMIGRMIINGEVNPVAGEAEDGFLIGTDMADAVQVHLDCCRPLMADATRFMIEDFFHLPGIHPLFGGTPDFGWLRNDLDGGPHRAGIVDYKHGAGIVVQAEWNSQLLYYAVGFLVRNGLWRNVEEVELTIVQPRGWMDAVRTWTVTMDELEQWRHDVLEPSLTLAGNLIREVQAEKMTPDDLFRLGLLRSGEQCRFCPVNQLQCPQLVADTERVVTLMKQLKTLPTIDSKGKVTDMGSVPGYTTDEVGEFLTLFEVMKIVNKAVGKLGVERSMADQRVPGWKLAEGQTKRVWSDEGKAEEELVERYGDEAFEVALLSPAKVEKLPEGTKFTTRLAHKPKGNLVLVPEEDPRRAVNTSTKSLFNAKPKE